MPNKLNFGTVRENSNTIWYIDQALLNSQMPWRHDFNYHIVLWIRIICVCVCLGCVINCLSFRRCARWMRQIHRIQMESKTINNLGDSNDIVEFIWIYAFHWEPIPNLCTRYYPRSPEKNVIVCFMLFWVVLKKFEYFEGKKCVCVQWKQNLGIYYSKKEVKKSGKNICTINSFFFLAI